MLLANLGSVAQTQAELRVYRWPEWPIQDEIRRSRAVDLTAANRYFRAALVLRSDNATAHRRLGQIALSEGDYQAARQHLESARTAANEKVTNLMLGEAHAVLGDSERAVEVWREARIDPRMLEPRQWWYEHIRAPDLAANLNRAVRLLRAQAAK